MPDMNGSRKLACAARSAGRKKRLGLLIPVLFLFAGCLWFLPTKSPIFSIRSADSWGTRRPLVVMLPGMGDRADDFVKAGFVDGESRDRFDVIAVDAHFGYYTKRTLIPRLHQDIIVPAINDGYENIWLLGISMGGFGSLLYASEYPEEISGVILLSPFLGSPRLIHEIEDAGGLRAWNGASEDFEQYEIDLWSWLKEETASSHGTPIILGYGRGERMSTVYGPLLQALGSSHVYTRNGGHRWSTWKPLWRQISSELDFSRVDRSTVPPARPACSDCGPLDHALATADASAE